MASLYRIYLRSRLLRTTTTTTTTTNTNMTRPSSLHHRSPLIISSILHSPPSNSFLPSSNALPHQLPIARFLSTLRRQPLRSRSVDIGARARQLQKRRLWTYALTFSCVAGFIIIILSTFQDQLVFYITPTEALEKFTENPSRSRFRLGGLVLEGSVVQPVSSPFIEFVVTDLITDILVRYQGPLPDLFREGHSVVVEGFVRPLSDVDQQVPFSGKAGLEKAKSIGCFFSATEVLAKHDEKYMPAEVAKAIEKNKAKIAAQQAEAEEQRVEGS